MGGHTINCTESKDKYFHMFGLRIYTKLTSLERCQNLIRVWIEKVFIQIPQVTGWLITDSHLIYENF